MKKGKKKKENKDGSSLVGALAHSSTLTSLAERVDANEKSIKEVKDGQGLLSANLTAWRNEMTTTMDQILEALGANQEDCD